jgi:hypothetical protein
MPGPLPPAAIARQRSESNSEISPVNSIGQKTGGLLAQAAGNQTQFRSASCLKQDVFRQIQEGLFAFTMREKATRKYRTMISKSCILHGSMSSRRYTKSAP